MTAKQIYGFLRRAAIGALFTSYLGRSFYLWNFNITTWSQDDRGIVMATYFLAFVVYVFALALITDVENDRIKQEEERKKRGW